jgi:outer membrane protein TolC
VTAYTTSRLRAALAASALALALSAASPARGDAPLTIDEAIRQAWSSAAALRASEAQVEAAREEAARARAARLPTLSLAARAVRTDEPMMAFGLKLDQGRITGADFSPDALNDPDAIGGVGGGVTLSLPVYVGGRLRAGQKAAGAAAEAEAADHLRRRSEVAASVVEAYFGAQAAEEGVRYAEDLLAHAAETERLVRERNAQGLALDADLARAAAFRAHAEAERAVAVQRRASARSALGLLAGEEAAAAGLATPIAALPPIASGGPEGRPDLVAARHRREAAEAGISAARGALLPALFAQASAETMRTPDLDEGTAWTTLGVVLRWDLSLADRSGVRAASARARAAAGDLAWREREASREAAEAARAVETADARVRAAEEAVSASESARTLRAARHRQGLLPLTDVLDAEAALAGARALLLASRLDARVSRARLALALHQPIEGLAP